MSVKGGDRLTPFMTYVRNLLLGRKYNNTLRYADTMSKRTQPSAFLPNGINDKLSSNDYYTRDGRREVRKPFDVYVSGTKRTSALCASNFGLGEQTNEYQLHLAFMKS
ncbi:unnamed protein product [Trichobilharzia regenti]|nr:unnamed protein product [Trichobilharzia regenti]